MNPTLNGAMLRRLRDGKSLTQQQLADKLNVTNKAVSKWETNHGCPDVILLEALAGALGVSIGELFSGERIVNTNRAFRMSRMKFYVCPTCGNILTGTGEALIHCCGALLTALEPKPEDAEHAARIVRVEDEYYVTIAHEMRKSHGISFIAALREDGCEIQKCYPEGEAQAYFKIRGTRSFVYYCNVHGLYRTAVR